MDRIRYYLFKWVRRLNHLLNNRYLNWRVEQLAKLYGGKEYIPVEALTQILSPNRSQAAGVRLTKALLDICDFLGWQLEDLSFADRLNRYFTVTCRSYQEHLEVQQLFKADDLYQTVWKEMRRLGDVDEPMMSYLMGSGKMKELEAWMTAQDANYKTVMFSGKPIANPVLDVFELGDLVEHTVLGKGVVSNIDVQETMSAGEDYTKRNYNVVVSFDDDWYHRFTKHGVFISDTGDGGGYDTVNQTLFHQSKAPMVKPKFSWWWRKSK